MGMCMEDDVRQAGADRYALSQAYRWKAERDKARQELRQLKEEVEGRLMPEGMTWPMYDDGFPVRIGDVVELETGCIPVEAIEFSRGKVCVKDAEDGDWSTSSYAMHQLKRPAPKVLDADGEEIRVGDTVWNLGGGGPYTVAGFDGGTPYVLCDEGTGSVPALDPAALIHRVTVLAADGKPLRKGETIWRKGEAGTWEIMDIDASSGSVKVRRTDVENGPVVWSFRAFLTHERPVLAADGKPLLDGDEVWKVKCGSGPYHVQEVLDGVSVCVAETHREFRPDELTHERPVLDADGAPIKVGDTVWYRTGAARGVVESIDVNSILPLVVYRGDSGELYRDAAEDVTHTKPEIDTWERIEEDARLEPPKYTDKYRIGRIGFEAEDMRVDLVRRAKALAERDA